MKFPWIQRLQHRIRTNVLGTSTRRQRSRISAPRTALESLEPRQVLSAATFIAVADEAGGDEAGGDLVGGSGPVNCQDFGRPSGCFDPQSDFYVHLLYPVGETWICNPDFKIGKQSDLSPVFSSQCNRFHFPFLCVFLFYQGQL